MARTGLVAPAQFARLLEIVDEAQGRERHRQLREELVRQAETLVAQVRALP
jgi:hypothetical protein